jgi:hypothetical protein
VLDVQAALAAAKSLQRTIDLLDSAIEIIESGDGDC